MTYPRAINSKIVIPNNLIDRDIADANGFDVIFGTPTALTMVRNRPDHIKFVGHAEFLASVPPHRMAEAEAAVRVL